MVFTRPASGSSFAWGGARTPGERGGGLSPDWFEGGEGVPTNPSNHPFLRRGQRMQIVPIHHWHAKNRIPRIPLHFVSGPWTSIVAALDGGRSNIAVCRRYSGHIPTGNILILINFQLIFASGLPFLFTQRTIYSCSQQLVTNKM